MNIISKTLLYIQMAAMLAGAAFADPVAPANGTTKGTAIHGSFSGIATQAPEPGGFVGIFDATGNASHLGRITLVLELHVSTDLSSAVATIQFVAANGDTLYGDVQGQAMFIDPTTLSIQEDVTITGGSGRFADATGHLALNRLVDVVTGFGSGSFDGVLFK